MASRGCTFGSLSTELLHQKVVSLPLPNASNGQKTWQKKLCENELDDEQRNEQFTLQLALKQKTQRVKVTIMFT